jgi:hypothetical protein
MTSAPDLLRRRIEYVEGVRAGRGLVFGAALSATAWLLLIAVVAGGVAFVM